MKNATYILFLFSVVGFSQTTPSTDQNYVLSTTYQVPLDQAQVEDVLFDVDALNNDKKIEIITYYDGLRRPLQSNSLRAGGNGQDIITPVEYDLLGRQPKQYLPYPKASNSGIFVTNPLAEQNPFYLTNFSEDANNGVINPYSEIDFESSPLSRVLEQGAPGMDWKVDDSSNNDHTVKFENYINTGTVHQFEVAFYGGDTSDPTLEVNGIYTAGELYKSEIRDENWQTSDGIYGRTYEYKNKQGQVLLKRSSVYDATRGPLDPNYHDTYYVYDDYGNLTYVLSPKASDQIIDLNGAIDPEVLNKLGYQYKYDSLNRLIEKKIPGKEWEYILYDVLDRPVLTQDANLQADNNKWLFTKYDKLGRVVYTGIYTPPTGQTKEQLKSILQVPPSTISEVRSTSPVTIGDTQVYYTNNGYPGVGSDLKVLTVNYYDTYVDYLGVTKPTTVLGIPTTESTLVTTTTQGLPTVSKVRVLDPFAGVGQADWITTLMAYDEKGRVLYIDTKNEYLDTRDIIKSKLDFIGKVLETEASHYKETFTVITTLDYFSYDHMGRLINHLQQIDDEPMQLIASNTYDELGQLIEKKVGGELWETGYTNLDEVTVNSNTGVITKDPNAVDGWQSGGISTIGKIEGDGGISFKIDDLGIRRVVGLNNDLYNIQNQESILEIDYGFKFKTNGSGGSIFQLWEKGAISLNSTNTLYSEGDTFALEREGRTIYYYHNGIETYSYTIPLNEVNPDLHGDATIMTPGGTITDLNFYATTITKHLQDVDYKYNIRGWLTDINNVGAPVNSPDADDLFRFRINYNRVEGQSANEGVVPLYNGNIAQTIWKTSNIENIKRGYGYTYDNLNRIVGADSRKNTGLSTADKFKIWGLIYDKNGNIQALNRNGFLDGNTSDQGVEWDNLSYTYNGGNRLNKVDDNSLSNAKDEGFKDGINTGDDYLYDDNGNLTKDENKNITSILYNHLNLPTQITIDENGVGGTISYIYDATGIKLEKVFTDTGINPNTVVTQYAGNFIYQQSGTGGNYLQFISHPEGYIEPVAGSNKSVEKYDAGTGLTTFSSYSYVFQYKDHLGNVRLSYVDSDLNGAISQGEIIEESNYYPFGLKQKGYNNVIQGGNSLAQNWKYNGIELNESLGLNLYEMDFRMYDPAIARFNGMDPVVHFSMGTSVAFDNNPVFFADPSGADGEPGGAMISNGVRSVSEENNLGSVSLSGSYTSAGNDGTQYVNKQGELIHSNSKGKGNVNVVNDGFDGKKKDLKDNSTSLFKNFNLVGTNEQLQSIVGNIFKKFGINTGDFKSFITTNDLSKGDGEEFIIMAPVTEEHGGYLYPNPISEINITLGVAKRNSLIYSNYHNILSAVSHEHYHISLLSNQRASLLNGGVFKPSGFIYNHERNAYKYQINNKYWQNTSPKFKRKILKKYNNEYKY